MQGRSIQGWLLSPLHDFMRAFHRVLPEPDWRGALAACGGVLVGWWIYVPVHELMHVFGCVVFGGKVERLEISAEYGAALLRKLFPFVAVGSDYAGQLVGFDTGGNDWIYVSTVFAPYLLTIFTGVPVLLEIGRRAVPGRASCALLGATIPFAYASLSNIAGDYYELGSIPVSRLAAARIGLADAERWRSDDVFLLWGTLGAGEGIAPADAAVVLSAFALGVLLALATYFAGRVFHRSIARP